MPHPSQIKSPKSSPRRTSAPSCEEEKELDESQLSDPISALFHPNRDKKIEGKVSDLHIIEDMAFKCNKAAFYERRPGFKVDDMMDREELSEILTAQKRCQSFVNRRTSGPAFHHTGDGWPGILYLSDTSCKRSPQTGQDLRNRAERPPTSLPPLHLDWKQRSVACHNFVVLRPPATSDGLLLQQAAERLIAQPLSTEDSYSMQGHSPSGSRFSHQQRQSQSSASVPGDFATSFVTSYERSTHEADLDAENAHSFVEDQGTGDSCVPWWLKCNNNQHQLPNLLPNPTGDKRKTNARQDSNENKKRVRPLPVVDLHLDEGEDSQSLSEKCTIHQPFLDGSSLSGCWPRRPPRSFNGIGRSCTSGGAECTEDEISTSNAQRWFLWNHFKHQSSLLL